jgi:hypothetical protein
MSQLRPNKVLVFHLRGGPRGPYSVRGNITEDPSSAAHGLWALTRMGTVGRHFNWYDEDGKALGYKVIDKIEESDSIIVTCERVSSVDSSET